MMYPEFQRMLELVKQGPGGEPSLTLFAPAAESSWQPHVRRPLRRFSFRRLPYCGLMPWPVRGTLACTGALAPEGCISLLVADREVLG